jgi:hypothetical protein
MVNDVKIELPVKLDGPPGRGALPAIIVPVEPPPAETPLIEVERDRFHMDPCGQGMAFEELLEDGHADRSGQHPYLMAVSSGQQRAEADFTLGALLGLTREG